MRQVLVTGGSGLVGSRLIKLLLEQGIIVHNLSSSSKQLNGVKNFKWNYSQGYIEDGALENVDTIFHLAGASVADKRWTKQRMNEILNSRVKTAELLFEHVENTANKPEAIISSSGISYYGTTITNHPHIETNARGKGFLADVSVEWEKSVSEFSNLGIRNCSLRTGIVLAPNGGALSKIAQPIKFGIGSALASGKQILPWIHVNDLVRMYVFAATNQWSGVYNAVSGHNPSNAEFTQEVALQLNRKLIMPHIPAFALKLILGKMATEIAIEGAAVSAEKAKKAGFQFSETQLSSALKSCL